MWQNYLKIAWRNIKKNRLYSLINVLGLSTGIISCLLIGLFVWNALHYDTFHTKADRIARVYMDFQYAGTRTQADVTGTKVGPEFKRSFPQVESFVRTYKSTHAVSYQDKHFEEKGILYADSSFFQIFSFTLRSGNPRTALDGPGKVLLTPETAQKYFGDVSPIGEILRFDGRDMSYEVTGIIEPAPQNSQIQYDLIASFSSLNASESEIWGSANYHTYLLLQQPGQIAGLEQKIGPFMKQVAQQEMGFSAEGSDYWTYHLEPLKDVYLHSAVGDSFEPSGNITYIYVLSVVALLILVIACVNYVNMATAQSALRSTEIGIRKVMGAGNRQLWKQFLGESFLVTLIATVIALIAAVLFLPIFNTLTGKSFSPGVFLYPGMLGAVCLLCLLISVLAGAYPAFILSRSKLAGMLKSGVRISSSGGLLRKGLIVFQFCIAVFLIAATLIVGQQLHYIQHKNLGFDREAVVVLPIDAKTRPQYERLREAMANLPGVQSATGAYEDPTQIGWTDGIQYDSGNGQQNLVLNATPVDLDYLQTMGMTLLAGRDFNVGDLALQDTSNQYADFLYSFILNEQAVKKIGWTAEQAIGKTVYRGVPGRVVGVIRDFHFESLHRPIGPLLIFLDPGSVREMFVKIPANRMERTLKAMESVWSARITHRPFSYHFMDEDFNRLYVSERRIAQLFSVFSGIAIVLACLGLFALAAFSTSQRTKEIGIRKVMGATIGNITLLLSGQFLILVGMAVVIATALAWWAGSNWLEAFAYRIRISGWVFFIAGIVAILIALLAVGYHAIRAATSNPVQSLKDE